MPPAASPSRRRRFMPSSSSGVLSRSVDASPITTRRSAECPTRNPALGMSVPSRRSRYSAVERQSHGTPCCKDSSGMPSTRASIRMR